MWQRIQTLYLGVAGSLMASLFFCNVARLILPDGEVEKIAYVDNRAYLVMLIVLVLLQLICLLGFKWRMPQMRLSVITAFVALGFQIWLAVDYFHTKNYAVMSWTALFPLAVFVLDMLAAKNIFSDELMVRSAAHLRSARNKRR